MSVLIIIAKIFATIFITGGILGGFLYIWFARHKPTHDTTVETIAGIIVLALCIYLMYFVWFIW